MQMSPSHCLNQTTLPPSPALVPIIPRYSLRRERHELTNASCERNRYITRLSDSYAPC
jgi:hypothetical protein